MRKPDEIASAFAPSGTLDQRKTFCLVGIGGAGMAAIADLLLARGFVVRGSDATHSETIDRLQKLGADVRIAHSEDVVQPGDAVVLSDAIDLATSPEVRAAHQLGCALYRRSQVLGWLVKDRRLIAVTGTHGKTTTTGMIGAALRAGGLDPLIVVGADVPEFGGSVVQGKGEWAVIEACEAYDSLRDFNPEVAVLLNLEPDHLDFHGTSEALQASVLKFLNRAKHVIVCGSDPGATAVTAPMNGKVKAYGPVQNLTLKLPGDHNALNAGAAMAVANFIEVDPEKARQGIAKFAGAVRRLQFVRDENPTIIDDYAHHPTEIAATLQAVRSRYPSKRVVAVFQPHLYSRTRDFLPQFARALSEADFVVITDIYPAREDPIPGISSARIAELLTVPHRYVPSRHLLPVEVERIAEENDVIVAMGAGNISEFPPLLNARLEQTGPPKVWVVSGGDSAEREISILSGQQVAEALARKGYAVSTVDVSDLLLRPKPRLPQAWPDVAILAVHGTHAEDGAIQGFFEIAHVAYSGSKIQSSAIAMDKSLTKQVLAAAGLPVAKGHRVRQGDTDFVLDGVSRYVVKPNAQGSTVGLSFVEDQEGLAKAVARALMYDTEALIEEWVVGTEISVPVMGDRALPVVEIVPKSGRYDFEQKYTPGATEEICPARLDDRTTKLVQEYALKAHQTLGCDGITRTDMIISGDRIVILEVNTLPGMTATSLLPRSAMAAGIAYDDLCEWILQDAIRRAAHA